MRKFLTVAVLVACVASPLLGDSSADRPLPFGGFPIVAIVVCGMRKKQDIGGFLLFFFWQLYGGLAMSLVMMALFIKNYIPEVQSPGPAYAGFLFGTVGPVVLLVAQTMVATFLIKTKSWDLLKLIRWMFLASSGVSLLTVIFGTLRHDELAGTTGMLALFQAILWTAYLYSSKRVKAVFLTHDWEKQFEAPVSPIPA